MHNQRGILQDSSISPILFNIFINDLIIKIQNIDGYIIMGPNFLNYLLYADDSVLLVKKQSTLIKLVQAANDW